MQLQILVGTVHGNATEVAQALAFSASDLGLDAQVQSMDGLTIDVFSQEAVFLLCCSTTGSGDVPENAQAFFQSLDLQPRYLGHLRYGLVALGDSSYGDSFCGGGKAFDARLQDLGAQRMGSLCEIDAMQADDAPSQALAWWTQWATLLPRPLEAPSAA
jgi:MioC protein